MSAPSKHPKPLRRGAACVPCRRSKQACDAVHPQCGPCALRQRECNYTPFAGPVRKRAEKVQQLEAELNERLGEPLKVVVGLPVGSSENSSSSSHGNPSGSSPTDPLGPQSSELSSTLSSHHPAIVWPVQQTASPPPSLYDGFARTMLEQLLPYRDYLGLDIDATYWLHRVNLPASDPEAFHPAFLNVICLIGCSLTEESTRDWEEHYYNEARRDMQTALGLAEKIEDWLYANLLLGAYLLRHGRIFGTVELSLASVPIAVACNLHQLQEPSRFAQQNYGLLSPARDARHAADRINLWWSLWVQDKRASMALDIDCAFPLRDVDDISTPLPVSRVHSGKIGLENCAWITLKQALLTPSYMDASMDSTIGLRVKSSFLLSESVRTSNTIRGVKLGIDSWTELPILQRAIDVYLNSTPRNSIAYEDVVPCAAPLRPMIARTTLAVLSSRVILCGIAAENDPSQFQRQLAAARWMSDIYRELNTIEGFLYSYVCIAPFWACGRGVIEKEVQRVQKENIPGGAAYVETLNNELIYMNAHVDRDMARIIGEMYAPKPFVMMGAPATKAVISKFRPNCEMLKVIF